MNIRKILFHPFSGSPAETLACFTFWTSLLWILQASMLQKVLPLDAIEAIVWGEQLQLGQQKSPPLSGWLAYFFAVISNYHDWGSYLASQLCIVIGVFFTYRLAREFFDETESAAAALLLFFLPYYMPPAMKFCSHDTQIALLPGMAWFFWRAVKYGKMRDWLAMAVVSAVAVLGKYAAIQELLGCFAAILFMKTARPRLKTAGPYISGFLFLLLLSPHIWWLFQNNFLPVRHLDKRVSKIMSWYEPLEAAGTMIFPYLLFSLFLFLACVIAKRRNQERVGLRREILIYSLLLTLIPGGVYFILSLTGHSIIITWFSYLASLTGITVLAFFPWKCDEKVYKVLLTFAWIYFLILFPLVVLDVMNKPRYRIHADPAAIVKMAETVCRTESGKKIPCVYGDRWLAGVIQNYLPYRPPAFVLGDICDLRLAAPIIRKHGALAVFSKHPNVDILVEKFNCIPSKTWNCEIICKSQFGRKKVYPLRFIWLSPQKQLQSK